MAKIDLTNIIRVTLLQALRGLANINTSALALITDEVPVSSSYGTSRVYLNPTGVADDFGSSSETARLAIAIFGQNPNVITGGGYLVVIPRDASALAQVATIVSSGPIDLTLLTETDYNLNAAVDGGIAADEEIGTIDTTDLSTAEASLNSTDITAAGLVFTLSGEVSAAYVTLVTIATGVAADITLAAAGTGTDIAPLIGMALKTATGADAGVERVKDTIIRTQGAVEYFGIVLNEQQADAVLTELADYVQTLDKLLFAPSETEADIAGIFTTLLDAGQTHTRCLYYSVSEDDALDFAAGYASRGLSINFSGSNTAITMHLKEIKGLVADSGLTQSILDAAKAAGVDVYADFGVPKVFTSGVNLYFDQVYTRLAFKLKLSIAGFNYLATTNTKIPQTEQGINGLKSAYRKICQEFVVNGVFAPGAWTDATTFGDPADHIRNIAEVGYFIFSIPISQQSTADRTARIAPLVQIAGKDAGAIHSSDVLAFIEA